MSLKKNIIANYAGQMYVAAVGILMVPFYLRYMGAEAYGLIGFFAMLQVWFQILDVGLTQTMSREAARFRGGAVDAISVRRLLRSLEGIFLAIAIAGAVGIGLGAERISVNWLHAQHIAMEEVRHVVILMGVLVSLRWLCGLYRGVIAGFEALVWLNAFNVCIATARFMLVVPLLILVDATPRVFFEFQLVVALVELLFLLIKTYRLLPPGGKASTPWRWAPLRPVLKFSLGVAFTSSVWVVLTQTDKLILSKFLTLSDYGIFTLAVLIASSVTLISGPISAALQPRMAGVSAAGQQSKLIALYRKGTRMVGMITVPACLLLAFFPEQVLMVWTNNSLVATTAAPVLRLYALGNGILAFAAFPYYLQFARGELRLHVIGNMLFLLTLLPALVWAITTYGMLGGGFAWLLSGLLYFLLWIPVVHRRFMPGGHLKWMVRDVVMTIVPPSMLAAVLHQVVPWPQNRFVGLLVLGGIGLAFLLTTAAAAGFMGWRMPYWRRLRGQSLARRVTEA